MRQRRSNSSTLDTYPDRLARTLTSAPQWDLVDHMAKWAGLTPQERSGAKGSTTMDELRELGVDQVAARMLVRHRDAVADELPQPQAELLVELQRCAALGHPERRVIGRNIGVSRALERRGLVKLQAMRTSETDVIWWVSLTPYGLAVARAMSFPKPGTFPRRTFP